METTITLSIILILLIVAIVILVYFYYFGFRYPNKKIEIDISRKQKMTEDEFLDFCIINCGTAVFEEHINSIKNWFEEMLEKTKGDIKKIEKLNKRCEKHSKKAFTLIGIRKQTRYRQSNYKKYSYTTSIISNNSNFSVKEIEERITFLKEHDFYVTHANFTKENQRKALTKELKESIKQRDNYTCQVCGKHMPDEVGLHIDHIIPVSKGGKSIPSNLRVLCSKCNGSKGSK